MGTFRLAGRSRRLLSAVAGMSLVGVALVGVAGAPAAAADPPDPQLALAVAQWVTNGGATDLKSLGADFSALETAANTSDLAAISSSCAQLQSDVESAQSYDPIPDPEAQHNWSAALAEYARGATDCVAGADTSNDDLITRASTEIVTGSKDLDLVTARLEEIAGP